MLRSLSIFLLWSAGLFSLLAFGGVEIWALKILSLIFGGIFLLISFETNQRHQLPSKKLCILCLFLFVWFVWSLIPWPAGWMRFLSPERYRLWNLIRVDPPKWITLSMNPVGTIQGLYALTVACGGIYCVSNWSENMGFRRGTIRFIIVLGVIAASLAYYDLHDGSKLIYGFRPSLNDKHWGAFVNRNHFSCFLNLSALLAIGISIRHFFPIHGKRHIGWGLITSSAAAGMIWMSVDSGSKGGVFSLTSALLYIVTVNLVRSRSNGRKLILTLGVAVLTALFFLKMGAVAHRIGDWMGDFSEVNQDGRALLWRDCVKMGWTHWFYGVGLGSFQTAYPLYQTEQLHKFFTHAESEWIQCWIEWGLPGVLGILLLMGAFVIRAVRVHAREMDDETVGVWAAIIALGIHSMVDFPLHIPVILWSGGVLIGIALWNDQTSVGATENGLPHSNRLKMGLFVLGGVTLLFSLITPYLNQQMEKSLLQATERLEKRDDARLTSSQRVQLLETVKSKSGTWVQLAPYSFKTHQWRAAVIALEGDRWKACANEWRTAQSLFPHQPLISFAAGQLFLHSPHPEAGLEFLEVAYSISNQSEHFFRDMINLASKDANNIPILMPLFLLNRDTWMVGWDYSNATYHEIWSKYLAEEAFQRWMRLPGGRFGVSRRLMGEYAERVLEMYLRFPPRDFQEKFAQFLVEMQLKKYQNALQSAHAMWLETDAYPQIASWDRDVIPSNDGVTADDVNEVEYLQREGASLMVERDFASALKKWEELLLVKKNDPLALYGRAQCLEALHQDEKACYAWKDLIVQSKRFLKEKFN